MLEFYNRTGHDISDMLLSCHFRGKACQPEDFKVVSASPFALASWGLLYFITEVFTVARVVLNNEVTGYDRA